MQEPIIPQASHEGRVLLGPDIVLSCAVLEDGTRLLSQNEFVRALGRTGRVKVSHVYDEGLDFNIPVFLSARNLKAFISRDLLASSTPVPFQSRRFPGTAIGYRAEFLPEVCNVFIEAEAAGALLKNQRHIAERCRLLIRSYATVGIIALIDEATGFQDVRARDALERILEKYLSDHKARWAKTFPDEFYQHVFRLRGWNYAHMGFRKRPGIVGHYTNDIVYERLAPGVLDKLKELNPRDEHGRRPAKHFQWLTEDHGVPELKTHLSGVIALMRASSSWRNFKRLLERAYPKPGQQIDLFEEDDPYQ